MCGRHSRPNPCVPRQHGDRLACRHALSLYTHISSITWKYDDQARSAGSVSDRSLHDIRSFAVDAAEATTFAGVNRLWEMIG